jgi:cyclophilin family peptidyl-prolyl cis-trans isomerase
MRSAEIHTAKGVMKVSFGKVFEDTEVIDKIQRGNKIEKITIIEE